MLNYIEALEIIWKHIPQPVPVETSLENALEGYLAEPVTSAEHIPSFSNSAMDGFAVRSEDVRAVSAENPIKLNVVGKALAGKPWTGELAKGQAVYITTGAPVPENADCVIQVENTRAADEESVEIITPGKKGLNIRYPGEDVRAGQTVFAKHEKINPGHIGLLATLGITRPKIFRKPTVAYLSTGDELVQPDQQPGEGQIRNSNTALIRAQVQQLGSRFIDLGIASDNEQDLEQKLTFDEKPDILLTAAGVSMGEYDLVGKVLEKIGLETVFWKVAIKPGKPLLFGKLNSTLYFGLPGNPVSAAVVFLQFVAPVIRCLSGSLTPFIKPVAAIAEDTFKNAPQRLNFARGICTCCNNGWRVRSAGGQGSHVLSGLAASNCLVMVPAQKKIEPGDEVPVQLPAGDLITLEDFKQAFAGLLS